MFILTIRTDKPEAEIGLYEDGRQLAYEMWQAHRELGTTIHAKTKMLLDSQQKDWRDISGIVAFRGPGSFTGLRIGLSVGNALAFALGIPIVAMENPEWLERGIADLLAGKNDQIVLPEYGAPVHITPQKH